MGHAAIPFIVGLAGSDLAPTELPLVAARVRDELRALRRRLPDTPLVLLSDFAANSELAAAEIGLELGFQLRWLTTGPAPSAPDDARWQALRRRLDGRIDGGKDPRAEMCRWSHALLVIGDARSAAAAHALTQTFRSGDFAGAGAGLSFPCCGMVRQVWADGTVHDLPPCPGEPGKPILYGGESLARRRVDDGLRHLDAVNRAFSRCPDQGERAARQVLPAACSWAGDAVLRRWLTLFAQAETTSYGAMKRRQYSLLLVVVLFAAFSLADLAYGGLISGVAPLWLGLAGVTAAAAVYLRHRRSGDDELWVGCRALAEFLRVAIVWRVCGVPASVQEAVAEEQVLPFDWVMIATRSIANENRQTPRRADPGGAMTAGVADTWIGGQLDYFADGANKIAHHGARARRYDRLSAAAIALALAANVATIGLDMVLSPTSRDLASQVTTWTMYVYWALLSAAAVVASYSTIMAHAEHEADYRQAVVTFRMAHRALGKADHAGRQDIIGRLGRAAIRETAGWLNVHRRRPLRLPF